MEQDIIIIIGGLSAGPSAAAKARRTNENAKIILFEKTEYISYATCGIPYSLSGKIKTRDKLMVVSADLLRERFNVDVHLNEPVIEIQPEEHKVITPQGEYEYTNLIFTAGAKPFIPPINNLDKASNWSNCRTIEDYDKIIEDEVLTKKEHIVILGAGLIGVEVAENLSKIGKSVTVVELSPSILSAWDAKFGNLAESILCEHNISVYTNTTVDELIIENDVIKQARLSNGELRPSDYLIMGIGGKPNTQ